MSELIQPADIPDALSTTQTLHMSEASLTAIFDASPDAVLISDANGVIVKVSRQMEAVLGFLPSELIGQSVEVLLPLRYRENHPGMRGNFVAEPRARLKGARREIKALRKDGSECDVEISLSQVTTLQGIFVACSLRDLSDRKLVEGALRENEEKLRGLFALSSLGIALTDLSGRYLEFNEAFRDICGYTESELKAIDYWTLTPKKYEADEFRQLAALERTRRYGPYEKEYVRKDGSTVPLRLNGVLVTGRDGQNYIWSIVEDITAQKQAEDKIRELAFFDPLTGLPNRTLLQDRLNHSMAGGHRTGLYGAVLLIDLDNFKAINDTRGHSTGDMLLKEVAEKLKECVRTGDTVSRIGGDEFVVVLEDLDVDENEAAACVKTIAQKILDTLNRRIDIDVDSYQCSASIGATLFVGQTTPCEAVMKHADMAMYKSKAAGRNRVRFYDPAMEASVMARSVLESDLRRSLDEKQFVLHYQPQVTGDGKIMGAEALVRWQHPQRGLVSPLEFIPLAEETGLILPLGMWVLESACSQLVRWAARSDMADLSIAVNVSVHQFSQPDFVEQVLATLKATGVNPYRLKLELTETALAIDLAEIVIKMSALKAVGVAFSLDDFGTGYSSLSYLKRLPLDELKIDRSFVRDVLNDSNDAAIARTIVALAQSLGLSVIAEGVETIEQQEFLEMNGCHAYQGFLFSKALPLAEFEQFATRN